MKGTMSLVDIKTRLRAVVGHENVVDDLKALRNHWQDYSLMPTDNLNFVVRPKTTEEIRDIVMLANDAHCPILPSSSRVSFHGAKQIPCLMA